jgi:tetratricopeptide (TPR) repeat protein
VRDELEMYRTALGWLVERGRPAEAAEIAYGLMFFWLIRGYGAEGLHWYERILAQAPVPPAAESRCLLGSAVMAYTRGEVGRSRARLTCALERAQAAGQAEIVVQAENLCGYVELAAGNLDAARQCFTRSAAGFRELAIPWGSGNALIGLASVALRTGDAAEAEPLLDEATSTLRYAGPGSSTCRCTCGPSWP